MKKTYNLEYSEKLHTFALIHLTGKVSIIYWNVFDSSRPQETLSCSEEILSRPKGIPICPKGIKVVLMELM